jgi:glutamate carboxypeptidase
MRVTQPPQPQTDAILADIRRLVEVESPTSDLAAINACAEVLTAIGTRVVGSAPERLTVGGRPHLLWRIGSGPRVGLLGHFDTVWPLGTLAARPFRVEDGQAYGPGILDMKSGVVQALYAAAANREAAVDILLTSDEETGSPTSRTLIEGLARGWRAALVLEGSHNGAVKLARKGVAQYTVSITGRASHAGLEPEKGVNALVELAHVVLAVERLGSAAAGTSVSPTVAAAGSTGNVIPASAQLEVDVRTFTEAESQRVHQAMSGLQPVVEGATLVVEGGPNRPPMRAAMAANLFAHAQRLYADLGYGELDGVAVGGGSDGNLTAGVGTPTLDGLGAVGDGAHADHEHIVVRAVPQRAALVSALISELTG